MLRHSLAALRRALGAQLRAGACAELGSTSSSSSAAPLAAWQQQQQQWAQSRWHQHQQQQQRGFAGSSVGGIEGDQGASSSITVVSDGEGGRTLQVDLSKRTMLHTIGIDSVDDALAEWGRAMDAGAAAGRAAARGAGGGALPPVSGGAPPLIPPPHTHHTRSTTSPGEWERAWEVFEAVAPVDVDEGLDEFPTLEALTAWDPEEEAREARRQREADIQVGGPEGVGWMGVRAGRAIERRAVCPQPSPLCALSPPPPPHTQAAHAARWVRRVDRLGRARGVGKRKSSVAVVWIKAGAGALDCVCAGRVEGRAPMRTCGAGTLGPPPLRPLAPLPPLPPS